MNSRSLGRIPRKHFDVTDMNPKYKIVINQKSLVKKRKKKTALELFADNASIPGCSYLMTKTNSPFEKLIWLLVNIASLMCIVYVALHILQDWEKNPTFVTADVAKHPVAGQDFPGVSLCSVNKISKRRAVEFAKYLSEKSKIHSFETILTKIRLLGGLYDYSLVSKELILTEFEEFLDRYDNISETIDLAQRIVKLSPSCNDILMSCMWDGKKYDCADLFLMRLGDNGFCCMFNYMRPVTRSYLYENEHLKTKTAPEVVQVFDKPGQKFGLIVTLRNNYSDYFFTSLSMLGYLVQIFDPHDYPDKLSGALKEVLLSAGTEGLIDIEVEVLETSEKIRKLGSDLRTCKFPDEDTTLFGAYSNSDCFVQCKVKSMESLCGCVPFMLPINHSGEYLDDSDLHYCGLTDMACLRRYKEKWSRYYPGEYKNMLVKALQAEKQESLECDCQTECNAVSYKIHTNFVPFKSHTKNASKLNIFFTKSYAFLMRSQLVVTWFEGLSTFGGTVALFAGVSIVNLLEVTIFLMKVVIAKTNGRA